MSSGNAPELKLGDRVQVTFEGHITRVEPDGYFTIGVHGFSFFRSWAERPDVRRTVTVLPEVGR